MTTIIEDVKLDFSDVLLMPKRSDLESRSQVDTTRTFKFKHSNVEYSGTPIVVANMDHTGTFEMAKVLKRFNVAVALHKFYSEKQLIEYFKSTDRNPHTFYSMGITDSDIEKYFNVNDALKLHSPQAALKYVCIDVANGYSRKFVSFVERMRAEATDAVIMAGNVVTPDMVYDLLERGVDIVKVGIGPGSVCTTRKLTGVGYPQLSAILECQDAAHGAGGLICGDGGIQVPGDVAKAFAAGADFIMCGGLFSGHYECAGSITDYSLIDNLQYYEVTKPCTYEPEYFVEKTWSDHVGRKVVIAQGHRDDGTIDHHKFPQEWIVPTANSKMKFYGMSSQEAMDKYYGGKANYRASEGKVVEVAYKGSVTKTIEEVLGGLRSSCTYVGARRLKDLAKCATFVKVNRQMNNVFGAS